MFRFLADCDFSGPTLQALRTRCLEVDVLRAQDAGLDGKVDPIVLEFAAGADRIVLTHDLRTFPTHAYERLASGLKLPGVLVIPQHLEVAMAVEWLELIVKCSEPHEYVNLVRKIPF
jgi:hypothetical protein